MSNPFEKRFSGLLNASLEGKTREQLMVPIHKVHPDDTQPRKRFDRESLAELEASIRESGILQPLLVRAREDGSFLLIAGERRWRAARNVGLEEVPVVIFEGTDEEARAASLAENLSRQDLTPYERAEAVMALLQHATNLEGEALVRRLRAMYNAQRKGRLDSDALNDQTGQTILKVFDSIGLRLSTFAQHDLQVLSLPEEVRRQLDEAGVPLSAAEIIARASEEDRPALINEALAGATAVELKTRTPAKRQKKKAENPLVERLTRIRRVVSKNPQPSPKVKQLIEQLERELGLK